MRLLSTAAERPNGRLRLDRSSTDRPATHSRLNQSVIQPVSKSTGQQLIGQPVENKLHIGVGIMGAEHACLIEKHIILAH